jgi:hypothetical protein
MHRMIAINLIIVQIFIRLIRLTLAITVRIFVSLSFKCKVTISDVDFSLELFVEDGLIFFGRNVF